MILFQNFSRSHIIRPGRFLFLQNNTYESTQRPGLTLDRARASTTRTATSTSLLRYGVKVKPDVGEQTETVWLIDWENPEANHFAVAEEVTVRRGEGPPSAPTWCCT
jgi:type I site-specific restriction-modification system R (restriction) subunit